MYYSNEINQFTTICAKLHKCIPDDHIFAFTDQNRNKTTTSTGKPGSGTSSLSKRAANQPDIVRGSVPNAKALQEVSRLEALCESRTKELQYARMRLNHGLQGFDAMAVLVRYLTEQVR